MPSPNQTIRCKQVRLVGMVALLVAIGIPSINAQETAETITNLEIGFEGTYRVGKWTPVWVDVQADDAAVTGLVEITTPDGDGVPATYRSLSAPLKLAAGETGSQLVYVKFGRTQTWLTVTLRDAAQRTVERHYPAGSFPPPRPVSREVILTLGGDLGVAEAVQLSRRRGDDAYVDCRHADAARLPDQWFGYDSADTVVLLASNHEYLSRWSGSQLHALTEWVAQGGRLIVNAGQPVEDRWQAIYPGTVGEPQVLRRTTALEVFAGATQRLDLIQGRQFEMPVTVLSSYEGRPMMADQVAGSSQPIFLLAPRGFGMIVFSAIDLSAEPLNLWRDRPRLVLRLLRFGDEAEVTSSDSARGGGRVTHIGYKDLSGQLRAALEAFSFGGISIIPFSWVAGLIVVYILLIGPVDYYLLRNVIRRMEYTWLTFPLMALALAAVAIMLTGFYKGSDVEIRQLAVLDHDQASGTQRHTLLAHIYSPANDRYQLAASGAANSLLSWQGLPGTALGGMENSASSPTEADRYAIANAATGTNLAIQPAGVPINVWSTKSFHGYEWSAPPVGASQENARRSNLRETYDRRLEGQFANSTAYDLFDCQLLYDRWSYSVRGTVAAGDVIYLADEGEPRDLEWKMTRRVVNDDNKPQSTPWNPSELDVPRIVEMMMFHRAAGGVAYTDLSHRQMQSLDLSRHLQMGRAVLVGKTKTPAASLTIDGQPLTPADDAHWTYVRLVVPVAER